MTVATLNEGPATKDDGNDIKVRKMNFNFSDDIPEFWFGDNALLTSVMTAMSVSFPAGERYFIDSVRHYQDRIDNPALKKQVRGFIGQEANHTKEHIAFNEFMDRKGYPAQKMAEFVSKAIGYIQKHSTPEENLARTAALEHFTAILAGAMLEHPETFEAMHPAAAHIWAWHAIEEVEHRAVAFDVYQEQVGDDTLRKFIMVKVTGLFIVVNAVRTLILMQRSGHLFKLKTWAKGINRLVGRTGVFRSVLPRYFKYYRKDFHPSQHDYSQEVAWAKQHYLGDQA